MSDLPSLPPNTLLAGAATLSWIDPKTGLPEVDQGRPPKAVSLSEIQNEDRKGQLCRFSNLLFARITLDGSKKYITSADFSPHSGMFRGPSYMGFSSAQVGNIGRSMSFNADRATFRQLVGCRTESPEKIGKVGGGIGGGIVGGLVGGFLVGGPVGAFVGAVGGGFVGYKTGEEIAEFASAFPPIWTEIELTMFADTTIAAKLVSHSLFPSNNFYANGVTEGLIFSEKAAYDGDMTRLAQWKEKGWGGVGGLRSGPTAGNPWGMKDPGPELGAPKLPNPTPTGY